MKQVLLFLLILITSCNGAKKQHNIDVVEDGGDVAGNVVYPIEVSLIDAINNVDDNIKLSDFVESIEYIPLKFPDDYFFRFFSLYGYDEDEKRFILGDLDNVLTVDKTGVTVHQIGRKGQGPGEFPMVGSVSVDFEHKYIYVQAAYTNTIQRFDYDGRFLKKMFKLNRENKFISHVFYANDNFAAIGDVYSYSYEKVKDRLIGFGVL